MTKENEERGIKDKQIDTIIRAFVHHLPSEPAKVNFCSAMESVDTTITELKKELAALRVENEQLQKAIPKDKLSDFYEWEINKHSTEYEVEFRGNEIKGLKSKLSLLRQERDAYRAGLENLIDPDECDHFDHHGYCQTHFGGKPCANKVAKDLLAAYPKQKET